MPSRAPILARVQPPDPLQIRDRQREIEQQFLHSAVGARVPNFTRIATSDLQQLFALYDQRFFQGLYGAALAAHQIDLSFRLAPRFTNAGGKTTYTHQLRSGKIPVEIAISTTLLFESFARPDEQHLVAGCVCQTRVEALQRVFEHELLHLLEFHDFGDSRCSAPRFRQLAQRWFGHRASDHRLLRPADRARVSQGIQVGSQVTFDFEGRTLLGTVNRITKRATVLVPSPHGVRFSDGRTYAKYYVPLSQLRVGSGAKEAPRGN